MPEGTHVLKPSIYLDFRRLLFFGPSFFRERKPRQQAEFEIEKPFDFTIIEG
jgi:hypothetical protein